MPVHQLMLAVRKPNNRVAILDIAGEFTGDGENALMDAYSETDGARAVVLNFDGMDYMNSSGIGLLITLMIRVQRNKQKLFVYGLKITTARFLNSRGWTKPSSFTRTNPMRLPPRRSFKEQHV